MNNIEDEIKKTSVLKEKLSNNKKEINKVLTKYSNSISVMNELPIEIEKIKKNINNFAILNLGIGEFDLNNFGKSLSIPMNLSFEPKTIYLKFYSGQGVWSDVLSYPFDNYFIRITKIGDGYICNAGYRERKKYGFKVKNINSKELILEAQTNGLGFNKYYLQKIIAIG